MAQQSTKSIIVGTSVTEAFRIWSDFESFSRFMKHVRSVTRTGERTSHWIMDGPLGMEVEWDAQVTRLEPDRRIAWNSLESSDVKTSGQVTFAPLPSGQTEVTVTLQYAAGAAMEAMGRLLTDLDARLAEDLRHFKAYAEGARDPVMTGR